MLRCDGCGSVELTLGELQDYEQGAAAAVLCGPVPASGTMVRFARRALGLSREELAAKLFCDEGKISIWENGEEMIDECSQMAMVSLLIPSELS